MMDYAGLRPWQHDHAAQMMIALTRNQGALDASDTGTGKTYVACWQARQMQVTPLVVCPLSVIPSWNRAAKKLGVEVEAVNYEKVRGVRVPVLSRRQPICKENGKPYQGPFTVRLSRSDWGREVQVGKGSAWEWAQPYQMVIFDEVQRCGGATSLNSKLLIAARREIEHVLGLSATAADDPRQLKALGYALRLFELRGYKWWLMKHGCKPGLWGGFDFSDDPATQQKAMLAIHKSIFPSRGGRMRRELIPNFPKTSIEVKLIHDETGKAAALAEQLPDTFERGAHLKESIRIRQALELLRVEALADLALDYSNKSRVAIFVNFTRTIQELRKRLMKMFDTVIPVIDGSVVGAERDEVICSFQSNSLPVVLVNNQAGGAGIDLHDPRGKVERTSLISPCWDAKVMRQIVGRVHRDGGAYSQQFFVYFADTHEAEIAEAVSGKFTRMDALNDAILNGKLTAQAA